MKKLAVVLLCALFIAGCAGITSAIQDWESGNPEYSAVLYDEDNDGIDDTAIIVDKQGDPVIEDGRIAEVPGVRAQFDAAKELDETGEGLAGLIASLLGGGAGAGLLVAKLYRKIRPAQRTIQLQNSFSGMVDSIQKVRKSDKLDEATLKTINDILHTTQKEVAGLEQMIRDIKKDT